MNGRTLTGAWIETLPGERGPKARQGRTLTGAWIETMRPTRQKFENIVAPSQARGLKLFDEE